MILLPAEASEIRERRVQVDANRVACGGSARSTSTDAASASICYGWKSQGNFRQDTSCAQIRISRLRSSSRGSEADGPGH